MWRPARCRRSRGKRWSSASGRTSSPALPAAGLSAPSPAGRRRAPGSPAGPALPAWAGTAPGPSLPRRRSAWNHQTHAPKGAAEVIPPEIGFHGDANHFSYVKQTEEDGAGAHRHADPRADAASLLPRLPEERWDRAHDQPMNSQVVTVLDTSMAAAMPLAKPRKPMAHPSPMGRNHRQYLGMASRGWVSTSIKGR